MAVEQARLFLMRSRDIDEVKDFADKADAIARYQRSREAAEESGIIAAEIAVRAKRRLGELVAELPKAKPPGKKIGNTLSPISSRIPTLADHGISKEDSSRWQRLAAVPEDKFEEALAESREDKKPITVAAVQRLAPAKPAHPRAPVEKKFDLAAVVLRCSEFISGEIAECPKEYLDAFRQHLRKIIERGAGK